MINLIAFSCVYGSRAHQFKRNTMQTRRAWWVLVIMLGLIGLMELAGCSGETAGIKARETSTTMNQEKIDPALQMAIHDSELTEKPAQVVEILIRTRGEIDARQRDVLEREGVMIGSVMGDILTARIPVHAVSRIASLEFVVHMEMSRKQRLR